MTSSNKHWKAMTCKDLAALFNGPNQVTQMPKMPRESRRKVDEPQPGDAIQYRAKVSKYANPTWDFSPDELTPV